jgi:hypothetical protein
VAFTVRVTRSFSVTRCLLSLFSAYFALTAVLKMIHRRPANSAIMPFFAPTIRFAAWAG